MSRVVNPYSFVPFSPKPPVRETPEDIYANPTKLLHGFMDLRLENKSPLIIPDGQGVGGKDDHKTLSFFRLPDENKTPAIPGSEIRGLIRSLYETVTGSCVTVVLDHDDYSMRTPPQGAYKQRALLEHDPVNRVWRLLPAAVNEIPLDSRTYFSDLKDCRFIYLNKYRNGQPVWFTTAGKNVTLYDQRIDGARQGWISFNEPVGSPRPGSRFRKYRVIVLEKTGGMPLKVWTDNEPYRMMDDILNPEKKGRKQNDQKPAAKDYRDALQKIREKGGCLPVWYLAVESAKEKKYYLSNASIGRVHMNRSWEDVMGPFSPCKEYQALCPACLLFGTVADSGLKSRVRFTDALCEDWKPEDFGRRTLAILATPRPSAFEFYLDKPKGNRVQYWNYDYYGSQEGMNWVYRDRTPAAPRGRKFYWHGDVSESDAEVSNMNATAEFLKPNHAFTFRIYFDGITEEQLHDLQYAITLGDNRLDSDLQLKIGHAKPLGYGSVKIVIDQVTLRKVTWEKDTIQTVTEKQNAEVTYEAPSTADGETLAALKAICSRSKTKGKTVAYPEWDNQKTGKLTIYEWFSHNRKQRGQGGGEWTPLPYPTDQDITLEARNGSNSPTAGPGRTAARQPSQEIRNPRQGSGSQGRPSTPETVYRSAPSAAGNPLAQKLMPGSNRRAVIKTVSPQGEVLLDLPAIDSPFCTDIKKGCFTCPQKDIKRYGKGKQLRVQVVSHNAQTDIYEVKPIG